MPPSAPLRVSVEIQPASRADVPRVFRLAAAVAVDELRLVGELGEEPSWVRGPLELRFHLPGDPESVRCAAEAMEIVVGEGENEHGALGALRLRGVPPEAALRIERYVNARIELLTRG